jgi:hypothetical protein
MLQLSNSSEAIMNIWVFLLALTSLETAVLPHETSEACQRFSATFLISVNQTIDSPAFLTPDPELTFFKERMKFRDDAIQHYIDDTIKFFNDSYGLDFSLSGPNERNEYFFENAMLSASFVSYDIYYLVRLNNWIQTGNTRSTCYRAYDGGFGVTFSGEQTLHGSYGGADGEPVGVKDSLAYAFRYFDVCQQSPVIVLFQSAAPLRKDINKISVVNFDLYSRVLGYGKAEGTFSIKPDPDHLGRHRLVTHQVHTFPDV